MKDIYTTQFAKSVDQLTYNDYLRRLTMLARAVFRWEGLPNGIDEKFIEKYLFNEGRCMFFKDFEKGWMVTKIAEVGCLNYYDEPTLLSPIATNYNPEEPRTYMNGEECVVIYNNDLAAATLETIRLYAARLTEIQRTADINIIAQKTPVIVTGTEKQRLSLKAVIRAWLGNEPIIHGDKNLEGMDMKVLNTAAPVVFDKLTIEKNKMWDECMTFLGINNANMDKRERLVADEVQANNEQIALSAVCMLKARERAAKAMSEMCGCDIRVSMRKPEEIKGAPEGGIDE